MRLIDADKVYAEIKTKEVITAEYAEIHYDDGFVDGLAWCEDRLSHAPTVDAPVKHGHWTMEEHHFFRDEEYPCFTVYFMSKCSVCGGNEHQFFGESYDEGEDGEEINVDMCIKHATKEAGSRKRGTDYCPCCGAKMDGGAE